MIALSGADSFPPRPPPPKHFLLLRPASAFFLVGEGETTGQRFRQTCAATLFPKSIQYREGETKRRKRERDGDGDSEQASQDGDKQKYENTAAKPTAVGTQ